MNWRQYVRDRLPRLDIGAERELEIIEELAGQLDAIYERAKASGASDAEAMQRATAEIPDFHALARTLGRVERASVAAPVPGEAPGGFMNGIGTDVRLAWRALSRTPAFTAVAIATIAIGLGVGAAAVAVLDAVLIKPLRFPSPEQLMLVHATVPPERRDTSEITYLDAADLARETQVFQSLGVVIRYEGTTTSLDPPERMQGYELSPSMFETLGVQPMLGRVFTEAEGQAGGPPVVILGHGFWRRLGSRPDIVGETLVLDEVPHTIVGVMPGEFRMEVFDQPDHVYRPVTPKHFAAGTRAFRAFRAIARLRPGVSIDQADTVAATVGDRLAREYPDTNSGRTFSLRPLRDDVAGTARPALLLIAGLVALVLSIAAVNLGNLLIARAMARAREAAVRAALGAGMWRLARPWLMEAALLTIAGATGACFVAQAIVSALKAMPGTMLPRLTEAGIDVRTIVVLSVAAVAAMAGMAAIPMLSNGRRRGTGALRTGHETAGRAQSRARSVLVSAQTALAFLLVTATVLLTVSLQRLLAQPSGFDPGVVTMRIAAPAVRYPTREVTAGFYTTLVDELAAQPGIEKAGFVSVLPLTGSTGSTMTVQGREDIPMTQRPEVGWQWADPGYFAAMGIPVLRGRGFTAADLRSAPHVTLINETLARLHFGGDDPIGKRVYFGGVPATGVPEWHEIIGVVGDVRHRSLENEPDARAYDLFGQHWGRTISLTLRTTAPPATTAAMVRSVLARHDDKLAVFAVRSTDDLVSNAVATRRLLLWLVSAFALAGFGMALLGVYGIVACLVVERQREIGVRVALGATAARIHHLVMMHGLKFVGAGVVIGMAAAIALRRAIESQLFGITATNAAALAAVAAALLAAAALPCFIVARRAIALDPMRSLRSE
jgi:putative ABC transport system permease protein